MTTINEAAANVAEDLKLVRKGIRFNPPHHTNMSSVDWAREGTDESHLYTEGFKHVEPSLSVDSKTRTISQSEVMERHNSDNSRLGARSIDVSEQDKQIPSGFIGRAMKASEGEYREVIARVLASTSLEQVDLHETSEPVNQYVKELEEQHCKDAETIAQLESDNESLQRRLKGAIARQDENRSETLQEQKKRREEAEDADNRYNALVIETNRRFEKLERSHEIEVANLKHEIQMQDKALEKHVEDEKLIALLMKKGADFAERFAE